MMNEVVVSPIMRGSKIAWISSDEGPQPSVPNEISVIDFLLGLVIVGVDSSPLSSPFHL